MEVDDSGNTASADCVQQDKTERSPRLVPPVEARSVCHSVRILSFQLSGEHRQVAPVGKGMLPSYSNYLIGNNHANWHRHITQYREVRYPDVYPGIDLAYYGSGEELEYDFIVAPRAHAERIGFSITGLENDSDLRQEENGDLVISIGTGKIIMHQPLVLEGDACLGGKRSKGDSENGTCRALPGGRFRLQRNRAAATSISFELPAYDHLQTLVIDPVVSFSTLLGGNLGTSADGIQVDAAGNIYVLGDTNSTILPVSSGAFQQGLAGSSDAFIAKLSGDGSRLIYLTYLGGSNAEFPSGLAIDSSGCVFVTGQTTSTDFPVNNAYQPTNPSGGSAFISKLSADGESLVYSTYLGGNNLVSSGQGIAVDSSDEAVVVGWTYANDFPTLNAFQPAHAADEGNADAFVTKFDAAGTGLVFSTYLGGNGNDLGAGVALDPAGNIYAAGTSGSSNFPTTPASYQSTSVSGGGSFVSKLDPSGSQLSYSTYLPGGTASAIAVSASGEAFVTGAAPNSGFPTTLGAFQTGVSEVVFNTHAFVTELNSAGSSLVYSTYIAGTDDDSGNAIAVDAQGDAYVTGVTRSQDFPLKIPVQASSYVPTVPAAFVSVVNPTGSNLIFSTYLAGGAQGYGDQQGNSIAVDSSGNIYVAGGATTPGFPVVNAMQSVMTGSGDAFIVKFLNEPAPGISLSSSSLAFGPEVVGELSSKEDITLTNAGGAVLTLSSIAASEDFSATNTCTSQVAAGATCDIQVTFRPSVAANRFGQLSVVSNATIVPDIVALTGSGQDFALSGSPGTATVTAGKNAAYTLDVSPEDGFTQMVTFTCTGAPAGSTCTVSPSSVTPDGTDPASTSVTVTTTASSVSAAVQPPAHPHFPGGRLTLAAMLPFGFLWLLSGRSRRYFSGINLIFLIFLVAAVMVGCGSGASGGNGGNGGGGGPTQTGPGSYTIKITGATASGDNHSVVFMLNVT